MLIKYSKEILSTLVAGATSYVDVCRQLHLNLRSKSRQTYISNLIRFHKIDTTHFIRRSWAKCSEKKARVGRPLNEILVENIILGSSSMRKRLIKDKRLENKCSKCGLEPIWCKKVLTMHLDHINGNGLDYRIENLRILCPNCHSQTETYCGRNRASPKQTKMKKPQLGVSKAWLRRVERPDKHYLSELVWRFPTSHVAKLYGVSDNAIAKWCKSYGISKPPRGYWQQKTASSKSDTAPAS